MLKAKDPICQIGNQLKVNLFWLGRSPLIKNKSYKLKLGSARISVQLTKVINVIDASAMESFANKQHIDRHDVAECILETTKPIAYDLAYEIESTGRFVLVDNYEIAGGGIVLETITDTNSAFKEHIKARELSWTKSEITPAERSQVYQHQAKFIIITGEQKNVKKELAVLLETNLFLEGFKAYYLDVNNDLINDHSDNDEFIRRLGELARIFTDSGQILITNLDNIDDYDLERLKLLTAPYDSLVINYGENIFSSYPIDLLLSSQEPVHSAVHKIKQLLIAKDIIP